MKESERNGETERWRERKKREWSKINRHVFSPSDLQRSLCWFLLPLADSEAQSPTSHQPLQIFRHHSSRSLLPPVFPLSSRARGRGYVSAINIPTDFRARRLGNKRPCTSSWLIGSFIHVTEWYFCGSAFLDPLNDETACVCICVCVCMCACVCVCLRCHFASSLCDSLNAGSSVSHLQPGRWQRSREREGK